MIFMWLGFTALELKQDFGTFDTNFSWHALKYASKNVEICVDLKRKHWNILSKKYTSLFEFGTKIEVQKSSGFQITCR